MTDIDLLRHAATLMRERAQAAELEAPSPWTTDRWQAQAVVDDGLAHLVVSVTAEASHTHIASWHPAVALAVADVLDMVAETWWGDYADLDVQPLAVTAARAYLGEAE